MNFYRLVRIIVLASAAIGLVACVMLHMHAYGTVIVGSTIAMLFLINHWESTDAPVLKMEAALERNQSLIEEGRSAEIIWEDDTETVE